MSDKQKATVSITLVEKTCAAAFTALTTTTPPSPPLPLPSLHKDLLTLLTLLYSDTTKITLALNPSDPSYKAALTPLRDVASRISTLASNASSFDPSVHGRTLTAEAHTLAKDVIVSMQELSQTHLTQVASAKPKSKGKSKGEEYMVKTATVHEIIDRARAAGPNGLSSDNRSAVSKKWKEQSEIMVDTVLELEDDDGSGGEEAIEDDEWADPEFDFGGGKATTPAQKEVKKQVHAIVTRTSSVLEQIGTSLLSPSIHTPSNTLLDALLDTASPLINAVDDLVACIYDKPESFSARQTELFTALQNTCHALEGCWDGAKPDGGDGSHKGSRQWFVEQFASLADGVNALIWPESINTT